MMFFIGEHFGYEQELFSGYIHRGERKNTIRIILWLVMRMTSGQLQECVLNTHINKYTKYLLFVLNFSKNKRHTNIKLQRNFDEDMRNYKINQILIKNKTNISPTHNILLHFPHADHS